MDGALKTAVEVKILILHHNSPPKDQRVYIDVETIILTVLNISFHHILYDSSKL